MILLIDNYDSFVHNLARYLERLGQETHVVRNDALSVDQVGVERPRAIVLSPGPCSPAEAGISLEVVRRWHTQIPILGVCLGHQTVAAAFGARIVRASEPRHGRTSEVYHRENWLFEGLPNPFVAGRYHSLVVSTESWPDELRATAYTADGTIMALEHRDWPVCGVQFHPESILTEGGYTILANFLRRIGEPLPAVVPDRDDELVLPRVRTTPEPATPITF